MLARDLGGDLSEHLRERYLSFFALRPNVKAVPILNN